MRNIGITGILIILLGLTACGGGSSGTLMGRVVDGFGNPLGGDAVCVSLSNNPVVYHPDMHGNFIVRAPVGGYTLSISFTNLDAGFNFYLEDTVQVIKASQQLGTYTLLSVQNTEGWEAYNATDYLGAIAKFSEQAELARSGQIVWLPYMRYIEGEEGENTLLTQGVLSAENGLGWCYARGLRDYQTGRTHFDASLSGGYNKYDAFVGLAGLALGEGDGTAALDYLQQVIDEPGNYDSSQFHDGIKEIDLIAAKSLAQFLLGQDGYSRDTADEIREDVAEEGNSGSIDLLNVLDVFR
jgi:hypothetical protein